MTRMDLDGLAIRAYLKHKLHRNGVHRDGGGVFSQIDRATSHYSK